MPYLLAVLLVLTQAATPLHELVDGIDRRLKNTKDLSTEFEEISSNQTPAQRGLLKLKREGGSRKLRLEYYTGDQKLYVSNGKTLVEYIPSLRMVDERPVTESDNDLIPLMLLLGRENLLDEFPEKRSMGTTKAGLSVVELIPGNRDDRPKVVLEVDKSFLVHRLTLEFGNGDRTDYTFKNLKVDTGLKSSEFEFKPPGVNVKTP